jgi:hypothetical protein
MVKEKKTRPRIAKVAIKETVYERCAKLVNRAGQLSLFVRREIAQ